MQRSRTQVLFSFLPEKVFVHETGTIVRSKRIRGETLSSDINKAVLLGEIEAYLEGWPEENRVNLPLPSRVEPQEFRVVTPEVVGWEVWPLVFECARETCRRIRTFRITEDVTANPACKHCDGRLRQLRYYSAHECGDLKPMYVPKCQDHGYDDIYFDDTGSFLTSVFRCRKCGGAVVRKTAQSPCGCEQFPGRDGRSIMRAYTVRDTRTYYPHSVWMINFQSPVYDRLQQHPSRGQVSVAAYLGAVDGVASALAEVEREGGPSTKRMGKEEWATFESSLRQQGLDDAQIETIRAGVGPSDAGVGAVSELDHAFFLLGCQLPLLERSLLFDRKEVARFTLDDALSSAKERGEHARAMAISAATDKANRLAIEEVSTTWNFPIAFASFGYTRGVRGRGEGRIRGFAQREQYEGKTPIFAVATDTEAVLLTICASRVLQWLASRGQFRGEIPKLESDARREVLRLFVNEAGDPAPAEAVRTLVHSMAHVLLRALDDGQTGFGEASLAEWIVPETLTFAIFANSLKSYTLGALWTLLNNRTLQWLERAESAIWSCDNDPLCHQRDPRACERCLYISFGCRLFNGKLSRSVLQEFWRGA